MSLFSNRLKSLREDNNMTQKDLADLLNVGRTTLVGWENEVSTPNDEIKIAICDIFKISVDYLIGYSNIPNPYKNKESSDTYKELSKKYIELQQKHASMKAQIRDIITDK